MQIEMIDVALTIQALAMLYIGIRMHALVLAIRGTARPRTHGPLNTPPVVPRNHFSGEGEDVLFQEDSHAKG